MKRNKFVRAQDAWMKKGLLSIRRNDGLRGERAVFDLPADRLSLRQDFIKAEQGKASKKLEARLDAALIAQFLLIRRHGNDGFQIQLLPRSKDPGRRRATIAIGINLPPQAQTVQAVIRELFCPHDGIDDQQISNIRRLIWQDSLPVLHIAMAIRRIWIKLERERPELKNANIVRRLIANPTWVSEGVKIAERLRLQLPDRLPEVELARPALIPLAAI